MKKRILCLALALCLIASLLPMTTLAADDAVDVSITINFKARTSTENTSKSYTLKPGMAPVYAKTNAETGMITYEGSEEDYNIKLECAVDGVPTMTLNNAYINNTYSDYSWHNTSISGTGDLLILLKGTNTIEEQLTASKTGFGWDANNKGDLTFTSVDGGTLTMTHKDRSAISKSYGRLIFKDANVSLSSLSGTYGTIALYYETEGWEDATDLIIDGGDVYIHSKQSVGVMFKKANDSQSYSSANTGDVIIKNGAVVEMKRDSVNGTAAGRFFVRFGAGSKMTIINSSVKVSSGYTALKYAPYMYGCYNAYKNSAHTSKWTTAPGTEFSSSSTTSYFEVVPKAHTAEPTFVPATESNCTEQGNTAYYICEHGTYYSDAALMNPIEEGSWLLPLGDHIPQEDDGDPTTAVLCDKCGEVVVEAEEPAAPPSFDQSQVIAGTDLTLNFRVDKEAVIAAGGTQVKIERNGVAQEQMIPLTDAMVKDGHYVIGFEGIAAKEMGDEISMTICNAEGEAVSVTRQDSVLQYALRMLEKEALEGHSAEKLAKLKTLLVDMLTYGAMAQELFGYNTDNSVLDALTEEQKQLGTQQMAACTNAKATVTPEEGFAADVYQGTSFILNYKIDMAIRMAAEMGEGSYASVTFTNYLGQTQEAKTVNATKLSDGTFAYFYDGLVAADGRCLVEWTFYKADGTKVATVVDSMEQYVGRNTVTLPYLAQLINYSDAAKAYFTAV